MKRISILGSGWLGLPLAIELQQLGYQVKASSRSEARIAEIKASGISAQQFDIESPQQDLSFLQADTLIINITSKNIDAFKQLVAEIENSPIEKVLFISSTSVYKDSLDANAPAITEENIHALKPCPLLTIEELFQKSTKFKASIIRFAGLIGYQRHPGRFFVRRQEDGSFICREIANPDAKVNMIHRDDCIGIITQLIKQECWGEVFNACSNHHPSRREFYSHAIRDYTEDKSRIINFNEEDQASYKTLANDKVRTLLGYEFQFENLFKIHYSNND